MRPALRAGHYTGAHRAGSADGGMRGILSLHSRLREILGRHRFGPLIVSFLVLGVGRQRTVPRPATDRATDAVITAGDRSIRPASSSATSTHISGCSSSAARPSPKLAWPERPRPAVAQGLASDEAVAALLTKIGVRRSDS